MDDGIIDSLLSCLLHGHVVSARQDFLEAMAQGDVAAGVLVKEGLIEKNAALVDAALLGDQGDLAQHAGALIHADHLLQEGLTPVCPAGNSPAVPEGDGEAVNDLAVPGKGLDRHQGALASAGNGGGEDFLRRQVWNVGSAVHGVDSLCAFPFGSGNQIDLKVCPVGAVVAKGGKGLGVEPGALFHDEGGVGLPVRHRIIVLPDSDSLQDGLPEPVFGVRLAGEALLRPFPGGIGGHDPLVFSVDGCPVGHGDFGPALHDSGELSRIHACKGVGILGEDQDPAGKVLCHLFELCFLPGKDLRQGLLVCMEEVQAALAVAGPVNVDLFGPCPVAFLGQHEGKGVLLHGDGDLDHLSGLHIGPGPHDQLCIFLNDFFCDFHFALFLPYLFCLSFLSFGWALYSSPGPLTRSAGRPGSFLFGGASPVRLVYTVFGFSNFSSVLPREHRYSKETC